MDVFDLHAELERLGRPLPASHPEDDRVETDPPALATSIDRGMWTRRPFESVDAVCRFWLTRELLQRPAVLDAPLPGPPLGRPDGAVVPVALASAGGPGPRPAWRRPLAPLSRVVARGEGLVVVADTAALMAHGAGAVLHATALEVASGAERWSVPLRAGAGASFAVVGTTVLVATLRELFGLDAATGRERWAIANPLAGQPGVGEPPQRESVGRHQVRLIAQDDRHVVLAPWVQRESQAGPPLASVDAAAGAAAWTSPVQACICQDPQAAVPRASRLLHAAVRDGELGVFEARHDHSRVQLRARTAAPPDFDAGTLVVAHDALGPEDGYAVVRLCNRYGAGLADAVVVPGVPQPVYVSPDRGKAYRGARVEGLSGPRFAVRDRSAGTIELRDLAGRVTWSAPGDRGPWDCGPHGCLIECGAHPSGVAAVIADDGTERWRRTAVRVLAVRGDEAWLSEYRGDVIGVGLADGVERWRGALPHPGPNLPLPRPPLGPAADGHHLAVADDALVAWAI